MCLTKKNRATARFFCVIYKAILIEFLNVPDVRSVPI